MNVALRRPVADRSSRGMAAALVSLISVSLLAIPVAAAPTVKPSTFELDACNEALAVFLRPPEELAPFLPEGFTPQEVVLGQGELLIVITRCEGGVVNGKKVGPTIFSEIGIYVNEPEEAVELYRLDPAAMGGFPYYQVWHVTDERSLRRVLAKVGVDGGMVLDATLETPSAVQAEADVPWSRAPYSLTSIHPMNTVLFVSRPSTFWHVSKKGLAATTYRSEGDVARSGLTQIVTPADGPLAEMTGSATGIADGSSFLTYTKLAAKTFLLER